VAKPELTIGMAVYDDYDGVYFTLEALALANDLTNVEIIVVDNKPDSISSSAIKNLVEGSMRSGTAGTKYIPYGGFSSTAAPRHKIFEEASADYVACMDSHVLFRPFAFDKLRAYYKAKSGTRNLITGPLLYDDRVSISSHFADVWRSEMWGIWGQAWLTPDGRQVQIIEAGPKGYACTLDMKHQRLVDIPPVEWAGHTQKLESQGWRRLGTHDDDEFEIPGQGLGFFTCAREAWMDFPIPGFNPQFREFGAEEMYIHEKFRKRGDKAICLGFLQWMHRFTRPGGLKYRASLWHKVRNYVLGKRELGESYAHVEEHFVANNGKMNPLEWAALIENPDNELPPRHIVEKAQGVMPLGTELEIYENVRHKPRDLDQHMPTLKDLAAQCRVVTEFVGNQRSPWRLASQKY
jgi:hypothetical protein